jgi:GxxExxY protein
MLPADELNRISNIVIGCAIEVHSIVGPGLLELAYQKCMVYELRESGLNAQEQVEIPLRYKRLDVESAYRLDILVERELVLELKAVDQFEPVHTAQLLTYLKSGGFRLGLLLNFNVDSMRKGIKRVVNGL